MIVQIVEASIRPEQRDQWLKVIEQNAVQTRAEKGCLSFQVAEDVEVPNTFAIIEMWADMEAVHDHFRAQFEDLMAALGDVFAQPPKASIHEISSTVPLEEALAAAGIGR